MSEVDLTNPFPKLPRHDFELGGRGEFRVGGCSVGTKRNKTYLWTNTLVQDAELPKKHISGYQKFERSK